MSKKNETVDETGTDLIEKQEAASLPAVFQAGENRFEGADAEDMILPRFHVFQDTSKERDEIGKEFELGDMVDPIECRKLASNRIVPLTGWKSWAKWQEGESKPVYSTRVKIDVPPEDLEWDGDQPPAATEQMNWLVVVEGEPMPYVLALKRTSLKAGKTLYTLETTRNRLKRGPGVYEVTWTKESGGGGVYARIQIRAAGDPSRETLEFAGMMLEAYGQIDRIKTEEPAEDDIAPF